MVSFADISQTDRSFSCSRKEFIGRNGCYEDPAALKRVGLSLKRGTGQDTCAVLQTTIEILPGEKFEMSILLGQCENEILARELTFRYRVLKVAKSSLEDVIHFWNDLTGRLQVETPV